jgi:CofD-related protein of GAK system
MTHFPNGLKTPVSLDLTRRVKIPDGIKLERYRRFPELGPTILFFSGGTALKRLSQRLIGYTHNSIHIMTSFDSGGSSAKIRDAFRMISVGDLRNRLMALADQSVQGNPDIYRLFAYRLPHADNNTLMNRLFDITRGTDPLIEAVPEPMKQIICNHIRYFINKMPLDFDLRGASIGNIILTGGYLNNKKSMDSVLFIFKKLVEAHGYVKPVTQEFLHLAAELESGEVLVGQHLITGKETSPLMSPVKNLFLSRDEVNPAPYRASADPQVKDAIAGAEVICYPMGSFYTSIIANLLPSGIGETIASSAASKIYVPNTAPDPEQAGMDVADTVETILRYLRRDSPGAPVESLLNFVVTDPRDGLYSMKLDRERMRRMGVKIIDVELMTEESRPYIDPDLLIQVLLSLT